MEKKDIIIAVTREIGNMMHNDILCEYGVESFETWCNNGEVFENNGEDADACMQFVKEIAPLVDELVCGKLNINNIED